MGGQFVENRAIRPMIAPAALDEGGEGSAHRLKFGDLGIDLRQMFAREPTDIGAGAIVVLVERQQRPALPDAEPERTGTRDEGELVCVGAREIAIAVRPPFRTDEADILVIPNGLLGQAAGRRRLTDGHAAFPWRRRNPSSGWKVKNKFRNLPAREGC